MSKLLGRLGDKSREDLRLEKDLFFENPLNNMLLLWRVVMYILRQGHHHCESCAENIKRQLCGSDKMEIRGEMYSHIKKS